MTAAATLRRFHRLRLTVMAILGVSFMLVFFHRVAPGVVAADLMREFSTSAAALGSLAAMYFYIYTAMQIPAGVLADTLGARLAAGTGALVSGVGSIVFGLAPDFFVASVGRFLVGLGVSVVFVGLMRVNTVWWSEARYGLVSGIVVVLGNVGAILGAGPLAALLAVTSWRNVFVALGVVSLAIAALTFLFVRNRPEDAGLPSLRSLEGKPPHAPRTQHWLHDLRDVLRNRAVWPGFWTNIGTAGSYIAFAGLWGVPLLTDVHGLTRAAASLYTTVALVGLALGSVALGSLSDYLGRRKIVIVAAGCGSVLTWLGLLLLPWTPGASGFALYLLLGICASGFIVTYGVAKEVVPPAVAGMSIAVANTGLFLGAAIVQPLFGVLMDLSWDGTVVNGLRHYRAADYTGGLWFCLSAATASTLASLFIRETRCRNASA
jgi:sugar phosphate permease